MLYNCTETICFSLCETFNELIRAFLVSKTHLHQSEPLELIEIMMKSFAFC